MKLILSLGDITTEPLRKLNSKRSNEAAGADKNVLVAFIDCISSIIKLSEERKLHLTTKRFPSMIYFMLNKSEIINIINTNITATIQKAIAEVSIYNIGMTGTNVNPIMTNTSHISTFDL